jgi:hypothetical protein
MRHTALRGSLVFALAVFANLLGAPQPAQAGDVNISVLGLESAAGAPEGVATAITEAIRQRVSSTSGYRLVPGRDLVEVKLVFSCPDEAPTCMTQAAQSLGATKLIFGNLQPVGTDAYLVTLKLLDADKVVVEGWSSEQVSKAQVTPAALRGPAQKWFAALTGQGAPANVKLTGGVVGANVWLDGAQAGVLGADGLTLAGVGSGSHEVVVSKAGYEKFERKITVAAGATEQIAVELKAIAQAGEGEPSVAAEGPTKTEQPVPVEVQYSNPARIAAWALLGLGAVGIALGAYSSYEVTVVNSNLDHYRRYPCATTGVVTCSADGKTTLDPLDAAAQDYVKKQQTTGDNYTKLQWVGYGVGAALLATSAVFFYRGYVAPPATTTAKTRRSHWIVMPSVGPNSAGALALSRF